MPLKSAAVRTSAKVKPTPWLLAKSRTNSHRAMAATPTATTTMAGTETRRSVEIVGAGCHAMSAL